MADLPVSGALTPLQAAMVLASLRAPRAGAYIVQDICDTSEEFDCTRLMTAWDTVAQRHPALRSLIDSAALSQRPVPDPAVSWQELDWSGLDPRASDCRLEAFLREDWERGFDFDGVPIRFTLIRRARGSTLLWTAHHALLDGRSFVAVWREWFEIYDGVEPAGKPAHKVETPPRETPEHFWRGYLAGLTGTTGYVVDRIGGPRPATAFARQQLRISPEIATGLRALAGRLDVTLNTLVLGAWALLLSRYSGRMDVVFGVTRSLGPGPIGLRINTLPFRVAVHPDDPLSGWLKQIRERWIALRDYQETSLATLYEWSGLSPGTPAFDSVVVYDHEPPSETLRKLGGLWLGRSVRRAQRTDFPLMLAGYGSPILDLQIAYDTRLFGGAVVAGLARHLEALLRGFVSHPEAKLSELKTVSGPAVKPVANLDVCPTELFESQARRVPESVALEDTAGPISYAEVNRRANRLAGILRDRGAAPEQIVAVCLDRSPAAVVAVLAAGKAGAAFLPLDPGLPPDRLQWMLEDARPLLVVTCDAHAEKLVNWPVLNLDRIGADLARQADVDAPPLATPENAAYVIYTSGSTGRPKAVVVTRRSLANYALAAIRRYGIGESDRRLQFASLGADVFVSEVFNYLCAGAALVFGPAQEGYSLAEFLRTVERGRITLTGLPSTWWHEWVKALEVGTARVPATLRAVIVGMEKVNAAAFRAWKRLAPSSVRLFNAYGPAEATGTATVYEAGASEWEGGDYVPIGKTLDNVRALILDSDGNPVPDGVPGELYLGGGCVARGYLNLPDLNRERFLPDPYDPSGRVYRTGDIVLALPDDNLVFLGRRDRQVKIRGFRVELEEIETVLAEHPSVSRAAVVLDEDGRLLAYVSGDRPVREVLRRHLARRLPAHMIPSAIVVLAKLPLTTAGKIDRQSLPKPAAAAPAGPSPELSTETERQLAAIWSELLPVGQVGPADNFFELGGDSLRATRLLIRIQERFGKELPLAALVRCPSLVQLAAVLDDGMISPACAHPLFAIPGGDQNPIAFQALSRHLPLVHVLQAPPAASIPEMAQALIREIRAASPDGPYLLAGHCFGGLVAFEIACQLQRQGHEIGLLALVDTPMPGFPSLPRHWHLYLRAVLTPDWLVRPGYIFDRARLRALRRWRIAPGPPPADSILPYLQAQQAYVPGRFEGRIVQFVAADEWILKMPRIWRLLGLPCGWREVAAGGLDLRPLAADHLSILAEPAVAELGAQLRRLAGAATRTSPGAG